VFIFKLDKKVKMFMFNQTVKTDKMVKVDKMLNVDKIVKVDKMLNVDEMVKADGGGLGPQAYKLE
jgi:hypothetical protein